MEFAEVIKRRRMFRQFTSEPLAPGTADRLLRAAERAPSAGFSQGYSFLVLDGAGQCAPLWKILADAVDAEHATADEDPAEVVALSSAQLVIVPLACKDIYLKRYAEPDKGLIDEDTAGWLIPWWYVDSGFTALLILLAVTNEGLGAQLFGFDHRTLPGFRAQYGVPEEWMPVGAIAIGHPDRGNDPIPPVRPGERKPLAELVHRGHW
ncbi:MAG TPA: nitroreductase family protein [Streptosporangiaceae bacterium]|nr:nitroreductase family protein [Streptosporangiaceae bacterium]